MATGKPVARANSYLDSEYGTVHVQLHTGDPGAAGTSNVLAGDSSRKQATMASASGGSKAMASMSGPWTNGGTSETATHFSVWSAGTGGNFLASAALASSKAWEEGDTLALSSLVFTFGPLAS